MMVIIINRKQSSKLRFKPNNIENYTYFQDIIWLGLQGDTKKTTLIQVKKGKKYY